MLRFSISSEQKIIQTNNDHFEIHLVLLVLLAHFVSSNNEIKYKKYQALLYLIISVLLHKTI